MVQNSFSGVGAPPQENPGSATDFPSFYFCCLGVVQNSFSGLSHLKELILTNNRFTSFPDIYALKDSLEILYIGKYLQVCVVQLSRSNFNIFLRYHGRHGNKTPLDGGN